MFRSKFSLGFHSLNSIDFRRDLLADKFPFSSILDFWNYPNIPESKSQKVCFHPSLNFISKALNIILLKSSLNKNFYNNLLATKVTFLFHNFPEKLSLKNIFLKATKKMELP
jgi:hypothetical protein